jgi:small-conductance mechanosensitive channel
MCMTDVECWLLLNYESLSKSFRTGRLKRELHMVLLSATKCSCIAILCVSLVSYSAITLCVASQRVFTVVVVVVVVVYFVIESVQ